MKLLHFAELRQLKISAALRQMVAHVVRFDSDQRSLMEKFDAWLIEKGFMNRADAVRWIVSHMLTK